MRRIPWASLFCYACLGLNSRAPESNPVSMRGASIALGALWALGCGGDGPLAGGRLPAGLQREPGTTTVLLQNHVAAPYHLERVLLTVDGKRTPLSTVPPAGAAASVAMRVRLGPGDHTLQVLASATRGDANDRRVAALDTSQEFHVGAAPAYVSVNLSSATVVEEPEPHLEVAFQMQGGELAPAIGQATGRPADDQRCAKLAPVAAAMCHAESVATTARRDKDMARLGCASEKLAAMRTLASEIDDARTGGGDFDAREVVRAAEQRLIGLSRDIDQCVSADVMRANAGEN